MSTERFVFRNLPLRYSADWFICASYVLAIAVFCRLVTYSSPIENTSLKLPFKTLGKAGMLSPRGCYLRC